MESMFVCSRYPETRQRILSYMVVMLGMTDSADTVPFPCTSIRHCSHAESSPCAVSTLAFFLAY